MKNDFIARDDFTREEYQEISERAVKMQRKVKNAYWKRAYLRLADAADTLDAMEARTEEIEDEVSRENLDTE